MEKKDNSKEQIPQNQGRNAQTNVPTSTGSGGNKQQEENIVVESVTGKNNDVEAEEIRTEGVVGHNVDFRDPLPNVTVRGVSGDNNKVRVRGKIETTGVKFNMDETSMR